MLIDGRLGFLLLRLSSVSDTFPDCQAETTMDTQPCREHSGIIIQGIDHCTQENGLVVSTEILRSSEPGIYIIIELSLNN